MEVFCVKAFACKRNVDVPQDPLDRGPQDSAGASCFHLRSGDVTAVRARLDSSALLRSPVNGA